MKLELKLLACYLPYQLKIVTPACEGQPDLMTGLRYNKFNQECIMDRQRRSWKITQVQPILRTLSHLTKEITHDGVTFVPVEKVHDDELFQSMTAMFSIGKFGIDDINYGIVKKLLEWHFDIYGLIDAGLALPK